MMLASDSTLPLPFGKTRSSSLIGLPFASVSPVERLGQVSFHSRKVNDKRWHRDGALASAGLRPADFVKAIGALLNLDLT